MDSLLKKMLAGLGLILAIVICFEGVAIYQKTHPVLSEISCRGCNVVVLDFDIVRADAISCESKNTLTPNLCNLIKQSVYFTNDFSQSHWTLPSEYSTFTSLYPNLSKVGITRATLEPGVTTFAEYLNARGYRTYFFGPFSYYTIDQQANQTGYVFVEQDKSNPSDWVPAFQDIASQNGPFLFHGFFTNLHMPYLLDPGEVPVRNLPRPAGLPLTAEEFHQAWKRYLVDHYKEHFLPRAISENPQIFPPITDARAELMLTYLQQLEAKFDNTRLFDAWGSRYKSYMQFIDPTNPEHRDYLRMLYDTKLHSLDAKLGPFIDYILQPSVADHTVIVMFSPHGEAFGEHGEFSHDKQPYYFNELLHVPLAIKIPGVPPGIQRAEVQNIDIFPTVTELVFGTSPTHVQGDSLIPLFLQKQLSNQVAISMDVDHNYIIQDQGYALVYNSATKLTELYDLRKDPEEKINIAKAYPEIVNKYFRLLMDKAAPELKPGALPSPTPVDQKRQELIRQGYF